MRIPARRHKFYTFTTTQHPHTHSTPKKGHPRHERTSRLQRCSRPLCRSQTTTPPTPSHTTTGPRPRSTTAAQPDSTRALRRREEPEDPTRTPGHQAPGLKRLILQDPTVCLTPSPTNVRQRVPDQCHPPHRADDTPGADDSTSEHHHRASNP